MNEESELIQITKAMIKFQIEENNQKKTGIKRRDSEMETESPIVPGGSL